ncbi:MAG: Hpt domain-containing protein [Firmicutes bacterium]|nr:Hpt domain-containing protein [Bacillota bacterium]
MAKEDDMLLSTIESWGIVDVDSTLRRFCGDKELFVFCIKEFAKDENFERMKIGFENKNYQEAFETAHMLKGVLVNLGMNGIYNKVYNLVELLRAGKYSEADTFKNEVLQDFEDFKRKAAMLG